MTLQVDPAMALDEYNSNGQDGLDDLLAILDADQVCHSQANFDLICCRSQILQHSWPLQSFSCRLVTSVMSATRFPDVKGMLVQGFSARAATIFCWLYVDFFLS